MVPLQMAPLCVRLEVLGQKDPPTTISSQESVLAEVCKMDKDIPDKSPSLQKPTQNLKPWTKQALSSTFQSNLWTQDLRTQLLDP